MNDIQKALHKLVFLLPELQSEKIVIYASSPSDIIIENPDTLRKFMDMLTISNTYNAHYIGRLAVDKVSFDIIHDLPTNYLENNELILILDFISEGTTNG